MMREVTLPVRPGACWVTSRFAAPEPAAVHPDPLRTHAQGYWWCGLGAILRESSKHWQIDKKWFGGRPPRSAAHHHAQDTHQERDHFNGVQGLLSERKGKNLALTVVYVPSSLVSGLAERPRSSFPTTSGSATHGSAAVRHGPLRTHARPLEHYSRCGLEAILWESVSKTRQNLPKIDFH